MEFKDKTWTRIFKTKDGVSLKIKHEWEDLGPLPDDKDPILKRKKERTMQEYLLQQMMIDPLYNPEDPNGNEIDQLYDELLLKFHLIPDFTDEEMKMLMNAPEAERKAVGQNIMMVRNQDLKKKLFKS